MYKFKKTFLLNYDVFCSNATSSFTLLNLKYFHKILMLDFVYTVYLKKSFTNTNEPIFLFAVS